MTSTAIEKLPSDSNVQGWTPPQKAIMQQLGLINRKNWKGPQPDAPAGVVEAFLMQCDRTKLDPTARQIYAAEMGGKWTVLISIDGFRLIADRTGLYRGKKPTLWCGADGQWTDVWLSSEPPAAAKVAVMREGFSEPLVAVATYAGYCPRDRKTGELKPSGQWENNPSNQLAKCAEMLSLRQAFPNELSGLYGTEEMDQAKSHAAAPRGAVRQQAGWAKADAAEIRELTAEAAANNPPMTHVIATPKVTRDWGAEAEECMDVAALTALANEADAAGELGLQVGLNGDKDDGSAWTVIDVLKARKRELEAESAKPSESKTKKPTRKEWIERAKAASTPGGVVAVWDAAHAAHVSADLLDEIDAIGAKLAGATPAPVADDEGEPMAMDWPVAEPGSGGFEVEPGEVSF